MTTEPVELPGKYSAHSLAQQRNEGRPYGGVSSYINLKLGQVTLRHSDDNYTLVKTDTVTILAMYRAYTKEWCGFIFGHVGKLVVTPTEYQL
jgi:hypothetical protein